MTSPDSKPPPIEPLVEELMYGCLEGEPETWADAVERAGREHPALAAELGRRFASLVQAGMASDEGLGVRLGEDFGEFRLLSPLGGGAMGLVYLAWWKPRGKAVALKILRPGRQFQAEARRRFEREMVLARGIRHEAICEVFATGEHDHVPYIAMRFVDGNSLAQHLEQNPLPSGEDLLILLGQIESIARALAQAHDQGLVHRDVKPQNMMIDGKGKMVLLDFGLARSTNSESSLLTAEGVQVGTPAYMAPEAVRGEELDQRSDVYSLGATLYEALTGRRPFEAATGAGLMHRILNAPTPDPRRHNPGISSDLSLVVRTAMAKDPLRRYQDGKALAEDLAALESGKSIQAREPGPWLRLKLFCREQPRLAAGLLALFLSVAFIAGLTVELINQRAISTVRSQLVDVLRKSPGDLAAVRDIQRSLGDLPNDSPVIWKLRENLANHHQVKSLAVKGASESRLWSLEPTLRAGEFLAGIGDSLYRVRTQGGSPGAHPWELRIPKDAFNRRAMSLADSEGACVTWQTGEPSAYRTHLLIFEGTDPERCVEQANLLEARVTDRGILWIEADGDGSLWVSQREPGSTHARILLGGTDASRAGALLAHGEWHGALISPAGRVLYAWRRDATGPAQMWAWDAITGERYGPPVTLAAEFGIYAVCSPDGRTLLTASRFRQEVNSQGASSQPSAMGEVWALRKQALQHQGDLDPETPRGQVAAAAISSSDLIAVVHEDGIMRTWNRDAELKHQFRNLVRPHRLRFEQKASADSRDRLLVLCRDATAHLFTMDGQQEAIVPLRDASRARLVVGMNMVVMGASGQDLRTWDLRPAGKIPLPGCEGGVTVICAVPDDEMILGTSCGRLFSFDPQKGTTEEITFGEGIRENWILDVAVLRGKRWERDSLAVLVRDTGGGGLARLVFMHRTKSKWITESKIEVPKDWGRISRMSVDRDGVRCWVSTFSGLRELQLSGGSWHPKANPITRVNAWAVASSHGTQDLLATITNEGPRLWRVSGPTYSSLEDFPPHLSANLIRVAALALDPTHNRLAVATSNPLSTQGTFWLAEVPPQGQDLLPVTYPPELPLPISQFAFAPDGETLACGSISGVISLLVPGSDSGPQDLRGHQATVNALSFSSDGRYLVSGDAQGEVFLWHMEIESLIQATDQLLGR
ncbi:MAG TPA: hypothetical protein EYG26_11215 [Planctomycetes bacterium]|nr:hypothetical protein [Planctomycetota bacterium]